MNRRGRLTPKLTEVGSIGKLKDISTMVVRHTPSSLVNTRQSNDDSSNRSSSLTHGIVDKKKSFRLTIDNIMKNEKPPVRNNISSSLKSISNSRRALGRLERDSSINIQTKAKQSSHISVVQSPKSSNTSMKKLDFLIKSSPKKIESLVCLENKSDLIMKK